MNEKRVTEIELSKKLCELGVPQRSEFWWNQHQTYDGEIFWELKSIKDGFNGSCSAYLSDELLEWLPDVFVGRIYKEPDYGEGKEWNSPGAHWTGGFKIKNWNVSYRQHKTPCQTDLDDKSLPNALAKLLIYLIEQKIITVADLKEPL